MSILLGWTSPALLMVHLASTSAISDQPVLPESAKLLFALKDDHPDHFGMGMLPLGDIDKDGVTDFYVGARSGVQGLSTGQGYGDVFSGKSGKLLYRIESEHEEGGNYFGCCVRRIEDLDGDRIAEIAIGGEHCESWKQYAEVRSGKDGHLIRHWEEMTIGFDAGDIDGSGTHSIVLSGSDGPQLVDMGTGKMRALPQKLEGWALTGDLNGDGVRDILSVSEFRSPASAVCSGKDGHVLLYIDEPRQEQPLLWFSESAGDMDGDGFLDLVTCSYESANSSRTYPAQERRFKLRFRSGKDGHLIRVHWEELDEPGHIRLQEIGDIDGDGCADLFVATSIQHGAPCTRARIYSGKTGKVLMEIASSGFSFGDSACNLGDLDGDGIPEIVVGEHEYGKCEGRAWVISPGQSVR